MQQENALTGKENLIEGAERIEAAPGQYSLRKILAIWAAAALPMGLIAWVIVPALMPVVNVEAGFLALGLLTLGLVWQGVLAYVILRHEIKPLSWDNVKDRLWLHGPTNPGTGRRSNRMYLWMIPLVIVSQLYYISDATGILDELWVQAFPFLAPPPHLVIQNLVEPALGQWWLLGLMAVLVLFNYVLGEELIFRGILLPRMSGVFGKADFLANGIMFSLYHLHRPEAWPSTLLIDWIYPWAAKRFKSYWMAVILHAADAVLLLLIVTLAILGMAD